METGKNAAATAAERTGSRSGRSRRGPASDFAAAYVEHRDAVRSFLMRLTRDPHRTEDLCQETFLKAWLTWETRQRPARTRSWLFSIAHHAAVDRVRRRAAERRLCRSVERDVESLVDTVTPDAVAIEREEAMLARRRRALLWCAAGRLPRIYREVVRLRYRDGLALDRIAALTGVTTGNVKVRLFRARKRLAALRAG